VLCALPSEGARASGARRARAQAYAAARMAESVLRGMAGEAGVYEAAYVASSVTELPFFASKARRPPPSACGVLDTVTCVMPKGRQGVLFGKHSLQVSSRALTSCLWLQNMQAM